MAGHSHWAGIKHKKGRVDKLRSNLFSKLSREITVAAKLGDKDPDINPRLRSAIQSAKSANMPKDNIQRAIDKSELNSNTNYENIIYEGFGPQNIAVIVETLTDNKNRTASNLRTIFLKNGGNLGTSGSASHNFKQIGVIKVPKSELPDERIFEIAADSGANECISKESFHEIHCEKNSIYSVKKKLEKNISNFISTEIEWTSSNKIKVSSNHKDNFINFLDILNEDDDVQNVFTNGIL